jgi:hypothetical protein
MIVAGGRFGKAVDRRAASIWAGLDCRARWRPTRTALALDGGAATIALDVHLDDGGVVNEAVDRGKRACSF